MAQYQIPRQPTTRLELLPGIGLPEIAAALSFATLGYGVNQVLVFAELGDFAFFITVGFGLIGFFFVQGGQASLYELLRRQRHFEKSPKRMLYRVGTGGGGIVATKTKAKKRKKQASNLPKSVQEWFPVTDVAGGLIYRTDGGLVAAIRVEPINLGLRTESEQQRIMALVHEALNALTHPAQILSLPRPLDLDAYITQLESLLLEVNPARQRLLQLYLHHVTSLVGGGEVKERRYYILLPQAAASGAEQELLQRTHDLSARLRQADLAVKVLDDQELFDLLYVWGHPGQAAIERPPTEPPTLTPIFEHRPVLQMEG